MGSVEDNGNEMNKMSSACWNLSSIFAGQRDFIEDKLSLLRLAGPLLFKVIQKIPSFPSMFGYMVSFAFAYHLWNRSSSSFSQIQSLSPKCKGGHLEHHIATSL